MIFKVTIRDFNTIRNKAVYDLRCCKEKDKENVENNIKILEGFIEKMIKEKIASLPFDSDNPNDLVILTALKGAKIFESFNNVKYKK